MARLLPGCRNLWCFWVDFFALAKVYVRTDDQIHTRWRQAELPRQLHQKLRNRIQVRIRLGEYAGCSLEANANLEKLLTTFYPER